MKDCIHDCGHCIHHIPSDKANPSRLISEDGDEFMAYWCCDINKRGKYHSDGKNCDKFENRYETNKTLQEWLLRINNKYRRYAKLTHYWRL